MTLNQIEVGSFSNRMDCLKSSVNVFLYHEVTSLGTSLTISYYRNSPVHFPRQARLVKSICFFFA
jgi:hypothetical protein